MKLFAVIGLGQFGRYTAKTLFENGADVLAIGRDEKRVEAAKDEVGQVICGDATNLDTLRAIGFAKADTAVIALGEADLQASILACAILSDLGVGSIIVRASNAYYGRIVSRVGATKIIYPEQQMGIQLAHTILTVGIVEQVLLRSGQTLSYIKAASSLFERS